ncbi:hypothetical protein [Nocardia cyriacigeorgica]|uniref:hypothetical protein n=1 Tax=Nocardia cyriacigeorgica TaxID=135487 RepID=UPI0024568BAF|nr:hypothetical protein [Nocardia cyriacigeorgica]
MSVKDPEPNRSDEAPSGASADIADPAADSERSAPAASDAGAGADADAGAGADAGADAADGAIRGQGRSGDSADRITLRRNRVIWSAGAALVLAALGAAGYFAFRAERIQSREDAKEAARLAACEYAPVLADYNAQNLDTYFAAVLDGATGAWKEEFDATSKDLREVLTHGQVVSRPGEVQCAIESGDEHSARAVVVIGQSISSVGTQGQPREGQLAVTLSMRNVDGSWLVNDVSSPLLPQ